MADESAVGSRQSAAGSDGGQESEGTVGSQPVPPSTAPGTPAPTPSPASRRGEQVSTSPFASGVRGEERRKGKTVFLCIPSGTAAANLLRTNVFRLLRESPLVG